MSLVSTFEMVTPWKEVETFQETHFGYITKESIVDSGDGYFFWTPDEDPIKLDHMYLSGVTFVRFSNEEDTHARI
jgi:hypothetical protein